MMSIWLERGVNEQKVVENLWFPEEQDYQPGVFCHIPWLVCRMVYDPVCWNMFSCSIQLGMSSSQWTLIFFQRGKSTTNQICLFRMAIDDVYRYVDGLCFNITIYIYI